MGVVVGSGPFGPIEKDRFQKRMEALKSAANDDHIVILLDLGNLDPGNDIESLFLTVKRLLDELSFSCSHLYWKFHVFDTRFNCDLGLVLNYIDHEIDINPNFVVYDVHSFDHFKDVIDQLMDVILFEEDPVLKLMSTSKCTKRYEDPLPGLENALSNSIKSKGSGWNIQGRIESLLKETAKQLSTKGSLLCIVDTTKTSISDLDVNAIDAAKKFKGIFMGTIIPFNAIFIAPHLFLLNHILGYFFEKKGQSSTRSQSSTREDATLCQFNVQVKENTISLFTISLSSSMTMLTLDSFIMIRDFSYEDLESTQLIGFHTPFPEPTYLSSLITLMSSSRQCALFRDPSSKFCLFFPYGNQKNILIPVIAERLPLLLKSAGCKTWDKVAVLDQEKIWLRDSTMLRDSIFYPILDYDDSLQLEPNTLNEDYQQVISSQEYKIEEFLEEKVNSLAALIPLLLDIKILENKYQRTTTRQKNSSTTNNNTLPLGGAAAAVNSTTTTSTKTSDHEKMECQASKNHIVHIVLEEKIKEYQFQVLLHFKYHVLQEKLGDPWKKREIKKMIKLLNSIAMLMDATQCPVDGLTPFQHFLSTLVVQNYACHFPLTLRKIYKSFELELPTLLKPTTTKILETKPLDIEEKMKIPITPKSHISRNIKLSTFSSSKKVVTPSLTESYSMFRQVKSIQETTPLDGKKRGKRMRKECYQSAERPLVVRRSPRKHRLSDVRGDNASLSLSMLRRSPRKLMSSSPSLENGNGLLRRSPRKLISESPCTLPMLRRSPRGHHHHHQSIRTPNSSHVVPSSSRNLFSSDPKKKETKSTFGTMKNMVPRTPEQRSKYGTRQIVFSSPTPGLAAIFQSPPRRQKIVNLVIKETPKRNQASQQRGGVQMDNE